jgi:hypothetical protein
MPVTKTPPHHTHRELAQQPAKLPEFLAFKAHVAGISQCRENLLLALPGDVQDLWSTVTGWGFRLPQTDQVRECSVVLGGAPVGWHALRGANANGQLMRRLPALHHRRCVQGLQEELKEACRGLSAALTAAIAFLDSRQLGMVALLDRHARDMLRQAQVGGWVA